MASAGHAKRLVLAFRVGAVLLRGVPGWLAFAVLVPAVAPSLAADLEPLESAPWSSHTIEGTWWHVRFASHAAAKSWDATLVLTRNDEGWALGFVGSDEALAAAIGFHTLPLGRLGPAFEHEANAGFQPLKFPASPGDHWDTEYLSHPLLATVVSADASAVRVEYKFEAGRLLFGHAVYDPRMGFFREFSMDGWTWFETLDWGTTYACHVDAPWNLDLLFAEGSFPADDGSRPLLPVAARRDVPDFHPKSAIFLLAGGLDGPSAVYAQSPTGRYFSARAGPGAVDVAYQIGPDPHGTWIVASTSHPQAMAYAELFGFATRGWTPVAARDACTGAPPLPQTDVPLSSVVEVDRTPWVLAVVGSIGAGLALAIFLPRVPRFWLPLYARISRERVLDNARRSRILEWLRTNPGSTTQDIRRGLGLGWGATVHHLATLESHGLVEFQQWGRNRDWYVAGGLDARARAQHSALKRPRARQLYELIASHPGAAQRELAATMGVHRSTVEFHLRKLLQVGLVEVHRHANEVRFHAVRRAP